MFLSVAYAQNVDLSVGLPLSQNTPVEPDKILPAFDPAWFGSHLFWLTISFAIFYFLMARCIMPRIGSAIEMRRDRIASDLDRAASLKKEADDMMIVYEKQLEQARAVAHALARSEADKAKAESDHARAVADADLTQRLKAAEQRISALHVAALEHVDQIAAEITESILLALVAHPHQATLTPKR